MVWYISDSRGMLSSVSASLALILLFPIKSLSIIQLFILPFHVVVILSTQYRKQAVSCLKYTLVFCLELKLTLFIING